MISITFAAESPAFQPEVYRGEGTLLQVARGLYAVRGGPLREAGDDCAFALACARANAEHLEQMWCPGHPDLAPEPEQCFWERKDGVHGWMCARVPEDVIEVRVTDCGTGSMGKVIGGMLYVVESGGCPMLKILGGIDWSQPLGVVARQVLAAWSDGYDGDPHESGLTVKVTEGEYQSEVHA